MQDKDVAVIGKIQLKNTEFSEPYLQYVENMYPKKEYKMVLLVFVIKEKK